MKIPKKIKIGGHNYDVDLVKTNDAKKEAHNWGKVEVGQKKIYIERDTPQSFREENLFHELLHACIFEVGLRESFGEKKEEDLVNRLSKILYAVLKDNKFI